jgi:hypothetical protein
MAYYFVGGNSSLFEVAIRISASEWKAAESLHNWLMRTAWRVEQLIPSLVPDSFLFTRSIPQPYSAKS